MPETSIANPPAAARELALAPSHLPTTLEDAELKRAAISRALRRAARTARAPAGIISGGGLGLRARKGARAFRIGLIVSFVLMVIVPLAAESLYWGLLASKQYATEMKFAVRTGESSPLDAIGGMLGGSTSQQAQDTQIVANYATSRSMIEALDQALDLRRIFSPPEADYFSRFDPTDPVEELEKYWRKRVDVSVESMSGIIAVNVRAYTPEDSLALAGKIVDLSELLVNDLSTRSRRDALAQAQTELKRAEQRLQAQTDALRDARNAEGVLDASAAAEGINKIVTALRMELSRAEQDLSSLGAAAKDSPQSRVIHARMASLKAQIDSYSKQIAGGKAADGGASMADRLGHLTARQIDLDLARQQYAQASAAFESARIQMETQHAYLASFLKPTLAQKSTYPRRLWNWSIVVFPLAFGWAVLAALAFMIRDNMAK